MLGEPEPLRAALEAHAPAEGEDIQPLVQIAFYEGVHPRKGFDWILDRYGVCNAITSLGGGHAGGGGGGEFPYGADVKEYCTKRLVRALHEQLLDRLRGDIVRRDGSVDQALTVPQLVEGRDWLFEDDNYHIDVSHLSAVVQLLPSLHEVPAGAFPSAGQLPPEQYSALSHAPAAPRHNSPSVSR